MKPAGGREPGRVGRVLEAAVLLVGVLVICAPLFPPLQLTPNRDSGVFLYAAQRIRDGESLYRDVWDHKPPLIYLFNLAAVVSGAPLWGLWAMAVAGVGGAAWLIRSTLRSAFGRLPAQGGLAAASVLLAVTYKGNLPEEYGLLLQAVSIWLFASAIAGRARHPRRSGAAIGILGGLAVLLKPTLIGLWLAMALAGVLAAGSGVSRRHRLGLVLSGLMGGSWVLATAAAVLFIAGVWPEFWSSAVMYNLIYAAGGDRLARGAASLARLGVGGIVALGGVALLYVGALLALRPLRRDMSEAALEPGWSALALMAVIDLPIEALLSAGSGRLYLQYLTPWFPAVALLTGVTLKVWTPNRLRYFGERWAGAALPLGLAASLLLTTAKIESRRPEADQAAQAIEAVTRLTTAGSPVLVWGAETQVLALAERRAPSRYIYLYPLITVGYADEARLATFAADLRQHAPALVLDTSATNPVVPPLDPDRLASWTSADSQYAIPGGLRGIIDWLQANYHRIDPIGEWEAYVPNGR